MSEGYFCCCICECENEATGPDAFCDRCRNINTMVERAEAQNEHSPTEEGA